MRAFLALVRREFIEHRGAFFYGPLLLVTILLGATILAFTVGRIDVRFSGAMLTVAPLRVYEVGFIGFGIGWALYLGATLFFYCADGFAADKRNNAMLFWKSMPVSDFTILLSKLVAAVTILPGVVYGVALLSGVLLYGVALVATSINGTGSVALLGSIVSIYGQVALGLLVTLACGLLWYLPFMALVGALATVIGRWSIPVAILLPSIISTLEWVTLGGYHPLATRTSDYLAYRSQFPLVQDGDLERWFVSGEPFSGSAFMRELLAGMDWLQVGIGAAFALVVLYLASEYRRRSNAN